MDKTPVTVSPTPLPPAIWHAYSEYGIKGYAPKTAGVYCIIRIVNDVIQWIYIGEAKNVQERLLDHYNGKSDKSKHIKPHAPESFGIISMPKANKEQRVAVERSIIAAYNPAANNKIENPNFKTVAPSRKPI